MGRRIRTGTPRLNKFLKKYEKKDMLTYKDWCRLNKIAQRFEKAEMLMRHQRSLVERWMLRYLGHSTTRRKIRRRHSTKKYLKVYKDPGGSRILRSLEDY